MDRSLTIATVITALASLNLGVHAMYQEGIASMLGATTAQTLTIWYLLAFVGLYQLYRLGTGAASGWAK